MEKRSELAGGNKPKEGPCYWEPPGREGPSGETEEAGAPWAFPLLRDRLFFFIAEHFRGLQICDLISCQLNSAKRECSPLYREETEARGAETPRTKVK